MKNFKIMLLFIMVLLKQQKEGAGTYLFSQVVANQVFSAQSSLTTVFGMGTGGSSTLSAPAIYAKHYIVV